MGFRGTLYFYQINVTSAPFDEPPGRRVEYDMAARRGALRMDVPVLTRHARDVRAVTRYYFQSRPVLVVVQP